MEGVGGKTRALGILVLLFFSIIVILVKGQVSTELSVFLPEANTKAEKLLHHQLDKGASTHLIFIALSGVPTKELVALNRSMADALRQSDVFSKVTNSPHSYDVNDLSLLEQYRYLLSRNDLQERFSVRGFERSLAERLRGLASSTSSLEKRYLRQDPTGEVVGLLDEWQGRLSKHKIPERVGGVWFSADHKRALILVEIKADISKLDNQVEAVTEVRRVFDRVKTPRSKMIITGPAAFAVESGENIRDDIKILTYLAVFFVVLFLCAIYRSLISVFLVVSPLVVGVVAATAGVLFIYDKIHGITLAFGITLAGVAVDYPIHLLTGVTSDREAMQSHVKNIWRTLRLGVLSTVIAYAAFLLSGFGGLQQLGAFTIIGLIVAALFSRWVLPVFATRFRISNQGLLAVHNRLKILSQGAPGLRWIVVVSMVGALIAMIATRLPILHLDVDSLSPIKDSRRAEGKMLRDDLGFWFGGAMLIVTAKDKEHVLRLTEELEPRLDQLIQDKVIQGYDMASHFLPSQRKQSLRRLQVAEPELIASNLDTALKNFSFKPDVFTPFLEDIRATNSLALLTPEMLVDTPVGKKLEPLLFDFEDGAGGVILLHQVTDRAAIESTVGIGDNILYLHLKSAATDLVARSVNRVSLIMLGCVIIIYACLAWAFRSPARPLKIMIPTFSAAVVVAAILVFLDCPLSIFHLISLLLVIGLGLDYALFFNRLPENNSEWDTTFKSLWVCGVTTILVFGILMFSETPPLEAIGMTVGPGALISIVFAAMWAALPEKKAVQTIAR